MFSNKRRGSQPTLCHLPGDGKDIQIIQINICNKDIESKKKIAADKKLNSVTLDTIVDNLINEKMEINSLIVHTLFTTYLLFTTSENLVKALYKRFFNPQCKDNNYNNKIQIENEKIFAVLILIWVECFPTDFDEKLFGFISSFNSKEFISEIEKHLRNQVNKMKLVIPESHSQSYHFKNSTNLISFPKKEFSEQLTLLDQNFFTSLNLRHCLASWDKKSASKLDDRILTNSNNKLEISKLTSPKQWTEHFNALVRKVIASILKSSKEDVIYRIRIIEKWIDIALELRKLNNFSSLKAILSALSSAPIHRLSKVWNGVNRAKFKDFTSLCNLCNWTGNYQASRQLLLQEVTSMTPINDNLETPNKDMLFGLIQNRNKTNYDVKTSNKTNKEYCGTIPYLGIFLTDLVMIDTAYSDPEDVCLINFQKRKKEFEVLSHIKLLQSSASIYRLKKMHGFVEWFQHLPEIDEKEAYKISLEIFPEIQLNLGGSELPEILKESDSISTKNGKKFIKISNSESDRSSNSSSNNFKKMRSPSLDSLDGLEAGEIDVADETSVIVRFYLQKKNGPYRSIRIKSDDRTRTVIKNVLNKFRCYSCSCIDNYFIQQCFDNKSSVPLPDNCNVFHALRRTPSLIPECLIITKS